MSLLCTLEWVIMIIFSAQVFFGSIWGAKQLGQIWGRSLVTRLSALRFNFVWDLVWENLIAPTNYRFTPQHKSLNDFSGNSMGNKSPEDCEAIRCSWIK